MFRSSVIAAAIGGPFVASSSFAGFTLTALPSAQPATGAGLVAYDIFAQNDADPADGVNLQGVAISITTLGTNKLKLANFDDDGNGFIADQWNFGSGAQQNTIVDVNSSNFRIGARSAGQHTFVDYTGDGTPPLTADEAANGVSSFTADYAVLSAATSVAANTAPGARFARVVVKGNLFSFGLQIRGSFGGDVGAKSTATLALSTHDFFPPVITPANQTVNVVFGQIVGSGAPFSANVNITDASGDAIATALGTLPASVSNVTIVHGGGSIYTIAGTVAYSASGTDVVIPFSASSGLYTGANATFGSVTLQVTPEPATLGMLGAFSLFFRRRRSS